MNGKPEGKSFPLQTGWTMTKWCFARFPRTKRGVALSHSLRRPLPKRRFDPTPQPFFRR